MLVDVLEKSSMKDKDKKQEQLWKRMSFYEDYFEKGVKKPQDTQKENTSANPNSKAPKGNPNIRDPNRNVREPNGNVREANGNVREGNKAYRQNVR